MILTPLTLNGAFRIDLDPHHDARGFFARQFCAATLASVGLNDHWVQGNTSVTERQGTVRGLHFQSAPRAEVKMVRCVRGAIFDAIVDMRPGSASFGNWTGLTLSAQNRTAIYVPQGFAHGFQTLEPDCEVMYLVSAPYSPLHEGGIHHADPAIGIGWPLPVTGVSDRDQALPALAASGAGSGAGS
ncbi:dTDP-4-dehydrorhamnose 3,5-epimerase [Paracoccus nototheniae]|uniref:dTDP-4-dehydrorhamnose 3,5-epimerase n=1 Tax=Paracoccus nototheniae TaxID=2489002 RepID=A0ABW4E1X3_9RHOB|nr:dTDP-4-dehydrorhamnose 3,5-epimerase [Paracoccus nototheniae]